MANKRKHERKRKDKPQRPDIPSAHVGDNKGTGKERPPHPGEQERIAERRAKAFALRKAGASYRTIAESLGCGLETAYLDVQTELRALRDITVSMAEEVREMELRRLDDYALTLSKRLRQPNVADNTAVNLVDGLLRIQARRSRYLGLDAAERHDHALDVESFASFLQSLSVERRQQLVSAAESPAPTSGGSTTDA